MAVPSVKKRRLSKTLQRFRAHKNHPKRLRWLHHSPSLQNLLKNQTRDVSCGGVGKYFSFLMTHSSVMAEGRGGGREYRHAELWISRHLIPIIGINIRPFFGHSHSLQIGFNFWIWRGVNTNCEREWPGRITPMIIEVTAGTFFWFYLFFGIQQHLLIK